MTQDAEAEGHRACVLSAWPELARARLDPVTEGMSDARVFRVAEVGHPPRYLKMARDAAVAVLREEIARTQWLAARGVCVPHILRVDDRRDRVIVSMSAVPGISADADPLPPMQLAEALASGLARLHALSVADCPFDETLGMRLQRAADAVAAGEVDREEFESRNADTPPAALLARLQAERLSEDIVVVHGDATLANMLVGADGHLAFVDCGHAGRGDRYVDLAVLAADLAERYGAEAAVHFARAYGRWDDAKARYFADLYELF
jgi:aminoglycoside 3'-phosphotransferase-2